MPLYRIAGFVIDMAPRYPLLEYVAAPYRIGENVPADFILRLSAKEMNAKKPDDSSFAYWESISACRELCRMMAPAGVSLFHAAVVEVDGKGYAFSAPSGTGKSTHLCLWRKTFGKRVNIVNGDKPFIREAEGKIVAYGSPWCGKEGWNRNVSAPLAGLCFLEQAKENSIRRLTEEEIVLRVFGQLVKPESVEGIDKTLRLADLLVKTVPAYLLRCNISEEAARLSFDTMVEGKG